MCWKNKKVANDVPEAPPPVNKKPKTTYWITYVCANCHVERLAEIKRGVLAEDALKILECPDCGCLSLREKYS